MLENPAIQVVNILTPPTTCTLMRCWNVRRPASISCGKTAGNVAARVLCHGGRLPRGRACASALCCNAVSANPSLPCARAIAEGRFGRLLHADAYMKWFRSEEYYQMDAWRSSRRSGAVVTVQHAFHYIDLLQYLMGPVESVYARINNLTHPKVGLEDTLLAMVNYRNGAQGIVQASTGLSPGTDVRIEINGEHGAVRWWPNAWKPGNSKMSVPRTKRSAGTAALPSAPACEGPADFGFHDHQVVIEDRSTRSTADATR